MSERIACSLFILCLLCAVESTEAQMIRKSWIDTYEIQSKVQKKVFQEKFTLAQWVAQVQQTPAKTPDDIYLKYYVLSRAGMTEDAIAVLKTLEQCDFGARDGLIHNMYYRATDQLNDWKLAQAIVEIFANDLHGHFALDNRLLRYWQDNGWSVQQIDDWINQQYQRTQSIFWLSQRLSFLYRHQQSRPVEKQLIKQIHDQSHRTDLALAYINHLSLKAPEDRADIAWLIQTVKPQRSTDAYHLGEACQFTQQWEVVLHFFQLAQSIPLTQAEVDSWLYQAIVSDEQKIAGYQIQVIEDIARVLVELKRNDQAQKQMEKADAMRQENQMAMNPFLAGFVQNVSGARVMENRIRQEEELQKDDIRYWQKRVDYYRGRGEIKLEEEAWRKGLALTIAAPLPDHTGKGYVFYRSNMLTGLAFCLKRQNQIQQAIELLRNEIKNNPANYPSVHSAVNELLSEYRQQIQFDDPLLWQWLADTPQWEHTAESLLYQLLERTSKDQIDNYLTKAEKLTVDTHPTRAMIAGWVENRLGYAKRSIPLLRDAVNRLDDDDDKRASAATTLYESYLDIKDWPQAEGILPIAAQHLTMTEYPEWLGRIAIVAAQSGDHADAMRIWKQVAINDPTWIKPVHELETYGMRKQLIAYYRQMQKQLPRSRIPAEVLAILSR